MFGLCILVDISGLTNSATIFDILSGALALSVSLVMLPRPFPAVAQAVDPLALVSSASDCKYTLVVGAMSAVLTIALSVSFSIAPSLSVSPIVFSTLSTTAAAGLILLGKL